MPSTDSDRLDSWKQIAAHLRRSVRTVRRWEAHEGLPVHRQRHRSGATVYAFRSEIDAWQREARQAPRAVPGARADDRSRSGERSIAVLPFGYVGPDPDSSYLADGLTEEVIADLSRLRGLRVTSRTSSSALRGTGKDIRTIGRELDVEHLVEGAVRHEGARLRVAARLIDARRDDRIWSETWEGTLEDVFAIQERIARAIVRALELRLSPDEDRQLADRPIDDVVAWQCALRARQEALRWRPDAIEHAIRLLGSGLSIIGDNAELYAALGRAHLQKREAGVDLGDEPLAQAEQCARKARALDPGAGTVLRLEGWIHYSHGRIQEAVHALAAALERDHNDPDALGLLSNCYLISGRPAAARPLIDRLLAVDPLTPLNRCLPGWAAALEGEFEAAVEPYRQMYQMDPDNPMARLFYTWILAVSGRPREAREVASGFTAPFLTSLPARVASLLARALEGKDIPDDGLGEEMERFAGATEMFPRFLAQAHALAGNGERALFWLALAVALGFVNYPFLAQHDPFLRRLEGHPGFSELLSTTRARWEAFEVAPSGARRPAGP